MLNVNKSKGKVLFCIDGKSWCNISLNGEELEVVNKFRHLGRMISKDGNGETGVVTSHARWKYWSCTESSSDWEKLKCRVWKDCLL